MRPAFAPVRPAARLRLALRLLPALCAAGVASAAWAQPARAPASSIYTCIDDKGRKLTSDRPIAECSGKEQLLLNRDGSVQRVIPPTLTVEERAEKEVRDRKAAEARAAQQDAVRRDRYLIARFPNEAAHQKAREAALDNARVAIKTTETRLRELDLERRPLLNEAEFYQGKPLPPKLKQQIDANDAALEAQRMLASNQRAELRRINALFDAERERLQKLWGGAPAGSLGPLPNLPPVPAPAPVAAAPSPASPASR